jgi:3-oxoacyl-[acyl-carrier-protein] synthase II
MSRRRVVVTGIGVISPLSISVAGFWESLISGRSGVRPYVPSWRSLSPVSVAAPALFSGDIDEFGVTDSVQRKSIKKGLKLMSREIQMAVAASSHALSNAEIFVGQLSPDRVGISFGSDYILTTIEDVASAICACSSFAKTMSGGSWGQFDFRRWGKEGLSKMQPLWQLKYLPNMPASHIAILNNFHGPSNSITLRDASVGAVVGESVSIIASGRTDVMIAGATGGWLHPCKMISALRNEEISDSACCPFDLNRNGTVLGDGAAAIVLEEREHAKKRGVKIWCEVIAGSCKLRRDRMNTDFRREVVRTVILDVLRYGALRSDELTDKKNIENNANNINTNNNDANNCSLNNSNVNGSGVNNGDTGNNVLNDTKVGDCGVCDGDSNGGVGKIDVLNGGGIALERIGHINAYGLGGRVVDRAEALAINDVFGLRREPIPVVAAKGFWGNAGAGAGMFELIASIMSLKMQRFFPSINYSVPDPECPIIIADPDKHSTGDSFIKIAINPQGHASALLVKSDS